MNEFPWENEYERQLESVRLYGVDLKAGDKVRLWPGTRADIMDLTLQQRIATIESIEQDYDGKVQLAVVLDDDPGRDLGMMRQPGHRFFFALEEVEPMGLSDNQQDQP